MPTPRCSERAVPAPCAVRACRNDDGLTAADVAKKKSRPDLAATIERHMQAPAAPQPAERVHEEEVD